MLRRWTFGWLCLESERREWRGRRGGTHGHWSDLDCGSSAVHFVEIWSFWLKLWMLLAMEDGGNVALSSLFVVACSAASPCLVVSWTASSVLYPESAVISHQFQMKEKIVKRKMFQTMKKHRYSTQVKIFFSCSEMLRNSCNMIFVFPYNEIKMLMKFVSWIVVIIHSVVV